MPRYEVEVTVEEIITKTTIVKPESKNQTMARGAAEHIIKVDDPDEREWSSPQSTIRVVSSKIVKRVDI